ncbi:MAG: hypothetical protein ACI85I_000238 [Arenicella sp.]|jgi:hypothetical protein
MKIFITFFCFSLLFFASQQAFSQDDWTKDADIEDAELIIEKKKVLTLPKASRAFEKMTLIPRQQTSTDVSYKLSMLDFKLKDIEPSIRALKMQDEKLDKLYGNYVKAGFGNFLTPYLEGYFSSKRNADFSYGANIKHLSSINGAVDKGNSGTSYSKILGYGSYLMQYSTISADLGYERQAVRFYGYADSLTENQIDSDSIRQIYNTISANVSIKGTAGGSRSPLKYENKVSFYNLSDDAFDLSETNIGIDLSGKYELSDEASFSLSISPSFGNYKYDSVKVNRGIIKAGGGYHLLKEGLEIKIGAKIAYNLDSTTNLSRFTVYPDILARYQLVENKVMVFAKAGGDLEQQTFRKLIQENSFLGETQVLRHSHNVADLAFGVQLAPFEKVGLRLEGGYDIVKNFYYFQNNVIDSSKFDIVYDEGTTGIFNFTGELSVNLSNFRNSLKATFYNYNTDKLAEAIHRPTSEITFMSTYNYREKVYFNLEAFQMGGLKAIDSGGNLLDLDSIFDLNLKVDYLFSDVFSAFIATKNLLGNNYERFHRYQVRGLNVMVGATYAF